MHFQVVERAETWVAGLPVRSPKRALGKLRDMALEEAWSAVLKQDVRGPLASIYTDFAPDLETYNTQIVGYQCAGLADVAPGHLVARVPAGTYARFSALGQFPAVMQDLWTQIDYAETHRRIKRTFVGDFECYPHAYKIDLYLSIERSASA